VILQRALATMMAGLLAAAALAQSSDASLQQAEAELNAAIAHFSRRAYGTTDPRDDSESFRKMREATATFHRLAPRPAIADALDAVQSTFAGRLLETPPTLDAAIDECERRRDPQLTALVAGNIVGYLTRPAAPAARDSQFYGAVTPPRTGVDLLRNLKFALDHDAVLRDDFYAPETLRRFFGSAGEAHHDPDGGISASWDDGRCRYAAGNRRRESGKPIGGLRLRCVTAPNSEEFLRLFGKPAEEGNARLHYNFDTNVLNRSVEIVFDATAHMSAFDLTEEQR
jgi:hypothetical protein